MSDDYRIVVRPQAARQRFAIVPENIDPTPWRWKIVSDNRGGAWGGQASFKVTAWMRARLALALHRHGDRIERKSGGAS